MLKELRNNPPVIVQGITGKHGAFHAQAMLSAGTHIVAGVTPGKGGQQAHGVPVYHAMSQAVVATQAKISVVFVPAAFAKAALFEGMDAGIELIVCITEGIPVQDMREVLTVARKRRVSIIGPNCPGLLLPGCTKLGIIPEAVGLPGAVAIVSRSGTLTYEAAAGLTAAGIGQRYIVGIGGDALQGTDFIACLREFQKDEEVSDIILIGEIGGQAEQIAATYIHQYVTKPVYAYVVGQSAPPRTQLGHAGAIMGGKNESAAIKSEALAIAGANVAASLPELLDKIKRKRK